MSGGDHFMVNEFFLGSQMAFEAKSGTLDDIASVSHAESDGFFMRPIAGGVRTQPGRSGTVAGFAGDAFGYFERAAALFGRGVEGVAGEALGGVFRFGAELQDAGHALADVTGEGLIGTAVLVLEDPGGIFVLEDAAAGDGLDAAVATGGGAGTGADVFHGLVGIGGGWNLPRRKQVGKRR